MKNIIIGTASAILLFLVLLFIYTVYGRYARVQEISDGLDNAMEMAAEMIKEDRGYLPESNEEFVSDFTQAFLAHIDTASAVELEILNVDYTTGLLSIRATSDYKHLTGTDGQVSMEKTIILEQYLNEDVPAQYTIFYYIDGILEASYTMKENSMHTVPRTPEGEGMFKGWQKIGDSEGKIYTEDELLNIPVMEDISYNAIFEVG